jgi:hypothetical protein
MGVSLKNGEHDGMNRPSCTSNFNSVPISQSPLAGATVPQPLQAPDHTPPSRAPSGELIRGAWDLGPTTLWALPTGRADPRRCPEAGAHQRRRCLAHQHRTREIIDKAGSFVSPLAGSSSMLGRRRHEPWLRRSPGRSDSRARRLDSYPARSTSSSARACASCFADKGDALRSTPSPAGSRRSSRRTRPNRTAPRQGICLNFGVPFGTTRGFPRTHEIA